MTKNKMTDRVNAFGNLFARGFNFFALRALRLLGALGMGQSTALPQNSTFANRTNPNTTKVCKRAVFLPLPARIFIHLWYLISFKK
jgi:hypothetical protein